MFVVASSCVCGHASVPQLPCWTGLHQDKTVRRDAIGVKEELAEGKKLKTVCTENK